MESIKVLFERINGLEINYIVLRNYEDLMADSFLGQHPDIDFLCDNRKVLVDAIDAKTKLDYDDGIHYLVEIGGIEVSIDIREVGDGYYDKKWEQDMLQSRVLFKELCYIPNKENYYYSLLYHALIQKDKVSEDYIKIFRNIERELKIRDTFNHLDRLEAYMEMKNYQYVYPDDICVGFNIEKSKKNLIEKNHKKKSERDLVKAKKMIKRLLRMH